MKDVCCCRGRSPHHAVPHSSHVPFALPPPPTQAGEGDLRDRAELHSERLSLAVPSVIRLRQFVRVPHRHRVPLSRRAVFARDGHRCQYCHRPAENIDHVVPRSRGGTHTWENVVASCRSCNSRKEDRLLAESGFALSRPPRAPHGALWIVAGAGAPDPAWWPYLPDLTPEAVPA